MEVLRLGFYVDGLNFYYGALRGGPNKWLDLQLYAQFLFPHDELVVVHYFTARVKARANDPRGPMRQEMYLRALSTRKKVIVHHGRFTSRVKSRVLADASTPPRQLFIPHFRPGRVFDVMWQDKVRRRTDGVSRARVVIEEEKGSDVNLGVHLVNDAARGRIDKAIIVSNDSDLAEALQVAREFGCKVGLLNPHSSPTSKHLRAAADFEVPFRKEFLARCQFPSVVVDSSGRELHKPREWR